MRHLMLFGVLLVFGLLPHTCFGQLNGVVVDQFSETNPLVRVYENNGTPTMIYGKSFSTGSSPLESAQNHINDWEELYGQDIGLLVPDVKPNGEILQGLMPNDAGDYKFYALRFNQVVGGVPVFRSGVGFLVRNNAENPLVLTGFDVKEMDGFEGGTGDATATESMLANVKILMDSDDVIEDEEEFNEPAGLVSVLEESLSAKPVTVLSMGSQVTRSINNASVQLSQLFQPGGASNAIVQEIEVSEEKLVIWAGIDHVTEEPQMAVSFVAKRGSVGTFPDYDKYLIVASVSSGEILLAESQITGVDVQGSVSGRATDGVGSLECHPEAPFFLPYAEVSISGGSTVFADANGDFTIPNNGSSPVTVTSRLRGQYFEVFDQAANDTIPSISMSVTPPGPANFLHNPNANNEFSTANVNAYSESNLVRDYVLSYEPTFPIIDTQQFFDVNTNINSSCNAFYDGGSINFYRAGGGCNNTSFSDVVYHEYGHHLVNVSNNGQGQFGEGTGDVVGVLIQDEPILGHGFTGNCNAGIRNASNNHQYPCNGGIHDCGQLISGCAWDLRNELLVTEPTEYRNIGASLFFGMMVARGQTMNNGSTIDPSITIIYLTLDDDDNDIGNGTPHYQEIATAFGAHNMDAPPLNFLSFEYPQNRPELISPYGGVAFQVQVVDLLEVHQSGTAKLHVDRGNGFEVIDMNEISPGLYEANFPTSDCATQLKYYFTADTTNNNTQVDPFDAPGSYFTALSANSITTTFLDDFNTNMGWSVSGDATDGQWDRGVPVGGGDRGDPAADADGSGFCYLTDNVDGNSDVDDGSTTLTSPLLDATPLNGGVPVVRYKRWYSNNFGNSPEADVLVVEISNNNGASWTNLETVGPTGAEVRGGWLDGLFRISDFVTPTSQMRIRVTASDLGDGSVVEAGLDAFEIIQVNCAEVVVADRFLITRGLLDGGDVSDVEASDDSRLSFKSGRRNDQMDIEFKGVSPTETPGTMKLTVESGKLGRNFSDVDQTIEVYNYDSNSFELVDTRLIFQSDTSVVIELTGDLSDFVEPGSGCIEARISFKRVLDPEQSLVFKTDIDEMTWLISN